jgi:WD40 repeat protein
MNTFFKKIQIIIALVIVSGVHHVAFPAKSGENKALVLVKTIKPEQKEDPIHGDYYEHVRIVGITPDGKFLICRRDVGYGVPSESWIEIRDIRDGVTSESFGKVIRDLGHDYLRNTLITPQGNLLLSNGWCCESNLVDINVMSKEEPKMTNIEDIHHPSIFMSDLLISTAYKGRMIFVHDMNPKATPLGKELGRICDSNDEESLLAVAQKRKLLFVAQTDGNIKILNVDRFSKDKKLLEKITQFVSHTLRVTSLTVTPDEKYLISCHDIGKFKMGDRSAEIKMWNIHDIISKKSGLKEILLLEKQGTDGRAPYVTITPNGKLLIAREDNDNLASTTNELPRSKLTRYPTIR